MPGAEQFMNPQGYHVINLWQYIIIILCIEATQETCFDGEEQTMNYEKGNCNEFRLLIFRADPNQPRKVFDPAAMAELTNP